MEEAHQLITSRIKTILLALSASFLAVSIMVFPKESFEASAKGLTMWWEVVFPSLLPFFIVSELLIGFGVVTFIGIMLEPFMRPLFRVPGTGGFVWAMGVASGFPAGAKLTARLRQEKEISAIEAERLVSFTNSSNPLFMFGAIAVGFFENAALGIVLAICHYAGNLLVGLVMRFHGRRKEQDVHFFHVKRNAPTIRTAFRELHRTRIRDSRPIGKLLGDAVQSSITTLLMIGGFIILFSVLNKVLEQLHITDMISALFSIVLALFQLPKELSIPLLSGLFEITLGSQLVSDTGEATLFQQAILVSFILAFNGLSVQAQVASILAETDIRFKPFFVARILHGIFASLLTIILWKPLYLDQRAVPHSIIDVFTGQLTAPWLQVNWSELLNYGTVVTITTLILYIAYNVHRLLVKKESPR
jgi:sporulation integral membrane protein YlbJ